MTTDELLDQLKKLEADDSTESAHIAADELLLEFIGDERITAVFRNYGFWYA